MNSNDLLLRFHNSVKILIARRFPKKNVSDILVANRDTQVTMETEQLSARKALMLTPRKYVIAVWKPQRDKPPDY